ncbi:iron complex transport system permease protein [Devosia sp. YR412]|uniref:FecCD family ABC transporter permease n=1 Tax=Devosia sp. YR412 TaxID=1881030 RepID=UPI0008CB1BCF|nr:iron ABC transporter permease [Devosia sp. YR412]SEQ10472.1 iron complex transport system permease protein [Devosia sp. YR412]
MTAPVSSTKRFAAWSGVPVLLGVLALFFLLHIAIGAKDLPLRQVVDAIFFPDPSVFEHRIIRDMRLPRAVMAIAVGSALAVAGALMQGVTRNPLAEPGLLGLMAGASFAVVIVSNTAGLAHLAVIPLVAALGALGAAVLVFGIARFAPGGATPLTLTLSGAAVSAFLGTCVSIGHLLNEEGFDDLRVWLTGTLAGRDIAVLYFAAPWLIGSLIVSLGLARQVTALAMGDEVAKGLGVETGRLKLVTLALVVMLTACSVALAGPMGFIGLVIPHAVRLFVGSDYRWIVPYSALLGAAYLLGVDIFARIVIRPQELSTGIITAMIGAPLFIYLVRQRSR